MGEDVSGVGLQGVKVLGWGGVIYQKQREGGEGMRQEEGEGWVLRDKKDDSRDGKGPIEGRGIHLLFHLPPLPSPHGP